ncbi:hypothetical protein DFJ43DRAFT_1076008 [Lentinula guzmanii]|uniref:Uncharacterized protein n=1 Tax=Lentinula guzmanii TaxID=2804957 RepID=A0AA38JKL8_9AGAR|nr:hypothetical protein DFJ43DRAFT_1076008 [Lentinula guzmanii]
MFLSPTTSRPLTCIYQFHSKSDSDWSSRKMSFPSRGVDNMGRRPRKDEYKHNRLPPQGRVGRRNAENTGSSQGRQTGIKHTQTASSQGRDWVSQCGKHKTRAPRKERQTGAKRINRQDRGHNLLKYWGRNGSATTEQMNVESAGCLLGAQHESKGGRMGGNRCRFKSTY